MMWLCADEAYGRSHTFRLGVQDLGITYAVEIPSNLTGWLASRGTDSEPRRVDRLWKRGGPPWETWHVKDLQKGPSVWEARVVRFHPREEKVAGDEQWLIIARNVMKPKRTKYFLCNAEEDVELGEMLRVAFFRWHIERLFREGKNETGMDHFEGRIYQAWKRHLVLTSLSLLFLSEQRQRLQEALVRRLLKYCTRSSVTVVSTMIVKTEKRTGHVRQLTPRRNAKARLSASVATTRSATRHMPLVCLWILASRCWRRSRKSSCALSV